MTDEQKRILLVGAIGALEEGRPLTDAQRDLTLTLMKLVLTGHDPRRYAGTAHAAHRETEPWHDMVAMHYEVLMRTNSGGKKRAAATVAAAWGISPKHVSRIHGISGDQFASMGEPPPDEPALVDQLASLLPLIESSAALHRCGVRNK